VCGSGLGDPHVDPRPIRRRVGLVFQFPEQQLFDPTVGDDIAFGPRKLGCDRPEVRRRVQGAMAAVGLPFETFKDRYTFGLSGGEMRKVALAGVLALEPEVLGVDEPTPGPRRTARGPGPAPPPRPAVVAADAARRARHRARLRLAQHG